MAVKGKCRNCERDNLTIVGDHLCGGCYAAVKGIKKGTAEYDQALAAAKERFTNPDAESLPRGRRKLAEKPSTFDILKAQKDKIIEKQQPKNISDSDIIDVLNARRDELSEELDEITKAISIIEKYRG